LPQGCRQSQEFPPQQRIYWSSFSKLNIDCASLQTPVTLVPQRLERMGTRNNRLGLEHRHHERRLGAVNSDAQPFLTSRDRRHPEADEQ
jgi:hypothetical protein